MRIDESADAEKIDVYDQRILTLLQKNARITYQQLAKQVHVKRDSVAYRVKRLENTGVISSYGARCDFHAFGYQKYYILFQLIEDGLNTTEQFYKYLQDNHAVDKLILFNDKWDVVAIVQTKTIDELDKILTDLYTKFAKVISDQEILLKVRPYHGKKQATELPKLDSLDYQIINLLLENSRQSIVQIARKVGLSSDAVLYRMKKYNSFMEYKANIHVNKMGYHWYTLVILMNLFTQKEEAKLREFMHQNPQFISSTKTLGKWNVVINILAKSNKEFHFLAKKFRSSFAQSIKEFDTLLAYQEIKNEFYLKGK